MTKLEKLQERALRFVYKDRDCSYDDLLKRGHFLSLSKSRYRFLAIEVFKCVKGLNPQYMNNFFKIKSIPYGFRDSTILEQPEFNTKTYGYRSFRYVGAKLWNVLPVNLKNIDNLDIFKREISTWCHSESCQKLERLDIFNKR